MTDQHGGYGRNRIGFKKIGRHTRTVTHIVTHIVGNRSRVSGVVFRDTRFNLTYQVSSHISAFSEDATAEPRKNRNQAAAKTQGHKGYNVMGCGIEPGYGC